MLQLALQKKSSIIRFKRFVCLSLVLTFRIPIATLWFAASVFALCFIQKNLDSGCVRSQSPSCRRFSWRDDTVSAFRDLEHWRNSSPTQDTCDRPKTPERVTVHQKPADSGPKSDTITKLTYLIASFPRTKWEFSDMYSRFIRSKRQFLTTSK